MLLLVLFDNQIVLCSFHAVTVCNRGCHSAHDNIVFFFSLGVPGVFVFSSSHSVKHNITSLSTLNRSSLIDCMASSEWKNSMRLLIFSKNVIVYVNLSCSICGVISGSSKIKKNK